MSLETKLRKLREQKGWSQMDVAHQLDISQSAYNKWEAGQAKPTLPNLQKLAEIFEVDFLDLVQAQIPNIDMSNAKFEDSQSVIFESTINTLSPELISKILDNQEQMVKLMESQSKLIESLLKNNFLNKLKENHTI
ncbi:helix-turn-helix domain-containing protein [Chryseobacterium salviniae]|uniref:Helix-turn-helix transcriptional regulator n=1 Tax=Chryseobacterium salviniae TaxID=3101750 RepID=A0ABU6HVJ7_9FLAO|nr:helix-turn-helix transcriptional regulator [Chryseobacterium sp. T9W2-O]MEC3876719.1 helix-turn-helix transcriptional regulator [Chryseobacterium sp. T9W2-O]